MKKLVLLLLVCLVGEALPGALAAQVDLAGRYIWRGFDLLPDNHTAIQPSLTIDLGKSGLALNVWSSFALAQRGIFKYADEIDVTISHDFELSEDWELSAGFTLYGYWFADDFNFKDATSPELYATVTRTDLPLSPCLSVYFDLNLGSGLYVTLGGSRELQVNPKTSIELGGSLGFNSKQYIDKTGFSDISLYARVPLTAGKLTLTPALNLMIPLLDEVNEDTEIWISFSAAL